MGSKMRKMRKMMKMMQNKKNRMKMKMKMKMKMITVKINKVRNQNLLKAVLESFLPKRKDLFD